jgi:DNA-binding protein HU-beta
VNSVNKQDVINQIARDAKITKRQADMALSATLGSIAKALKKGDRVSFVGFGTFSVKKRAPRNARNPQTGEIIHVKGKRVPAFKAGQKLRNAIK